MTAFEACWEMVVERDIWDDANAVVHACLDALGIDPDSEMPNEPRHQ